MREPLKACDQVAGPSGRGLASDKLETCSLTSTHIPGHTHTHTLTHLTCAQMHTHTADRREGGTDQEFKGGVF